MTLAAQDGKPPMEGDGRSVFVRGLVTAEAKGLQRALAMKDWVYVVDTLRTSDKGAARFVMRDHTLLSMKPATEIARVDVEAGWGARVISATILPKLFEVERDETDPAQIALELLGRAPPDLGISPRLPSGAEERRKALEAVSDQAAMVAKRIDDADQVLLVGTLEQVPNPDSARTLAVIEGLLRSATGLDEELL